MRIEKLLPPTPPAKTWTVALEGGKTLRVTESTVLDQGLFAGLELDEAALDALRSAAASAALRARAVNMLSVRAMSAGQLNEKLMAKGATERQAAETVAWAVDIGLVNDAEYAKALVRHYQAKGYGLYKIKNELYRRRVPKADWEDALAEMDDAEDAIDAFLAKKLRDPEDRHRAAEISNRLTQHDRRTPCRNITYRKRKNARNPKKSRSPSPRSASSPLAAPRIRSTVSR